ncbi:MAG: LD-carboxypeptidase [Gemmatimonadota bacterium]
MGSKEIIRPPRLKPGSRVGLLAPAGPLLERDDLSRGRELCQALDWEPVLLPHAGGRHGYLAGTDEERLDDLNAALRNPVLDAIWCLRGGYGVTRILDQVDFAAMAARPRVIIGYSDITALLLAAWRHTGLVTFHGPMARAPLTSFSRDHQARVLASAVVPGRLGRLPQPDDVLVPKSPRIVTIRGGKAEGRLIGGNLTLVQCLIGTRHLPDFDGAILFLEEVNEDLYRIDRMLAHLRMAGALDRVAGVVVGQVTELSQRGADGSMGYDEILATYLEPLGVPVAYGFPFGHVESQWTLPVGVMARLDASAGELELLESGVS